MALEYFFDNGNVMCITGSFRYLKECAPDLDFTLFTKYGKNLFTKSPQYAPEIRAFFIQKFGFHPEIDFLGSEKGEGRPYNMQVLPEDDPWLDAHFLTGKFFPDESFLHEHYTKIFGGNYLVHVWNRLAEEVKSFPENNVRSEKRHKDMIIMILATQKLLGQHLYIGHILEEYEQRYRKIACTFPDKEQRFFAEDKNIESMLLGFITKVQQSIRCHTFL